MTTLAWFQDPWWAERASLRPHMVQHRAATSQIHERTRRMSGCCNNPTDRSAIQLRVICGQTPRSEAAIDRLGSPSLRSGAIARPGKIAASRRREPPESCRSCSRLRPWPPRDRKIVGELKANNHNSTIINLFEQKRFSPQKRENSSRCVPQTKCDVGGRHQGAQAPWARWRICSGVRSSLCVARDHV